MPTIAILYDFQKNSNPKDWQIVDDDVMGGLSRGRFAIDDDGHGNFFGAISLENNGGFSSIRCKLKPVKATKDNIIRIVLKGDGKDYQFRIKDNSHCSYSFIATFSTTGAWQEILIPLKKMYPSFRGQKLKMPNFSHDSFEEMTFLIANKKNEEFRLIIDKIELQ